MQERGASQEETASPEEVAGSPSEGEGTEVSAAKDRDPALHFRIERSGARNINCPIKVLPGGQADKQSTI